MWCQTSTTAGASGDELYNNYSVSEGEDISRPLKFMEINENKNRSTEKDALGFDGYIILCGIRNIVILNSEQ